MHTSCNVCLLVIFSGLQSGTHTIFFQLVLGLFVFHGSFPKLTAELSGCLYYYQSPLGLAVSPNVPYLAIVDILRFSNKTLPSNISHTKANSQNIVATVSGKYDTFLPFWDLWNSIWPNKSRGFNGPRKSHMSRPFSCVPCAVLPWWYPIFCRLI